MSPQLAIQILVPTAQLLFFLGGLYVVIKNLRKDLNGLGGRVRNEAKLAEARHMRTVVCFLLTIGDEQKRLEIARIMLHGQQ